MRIHFTFAFDVKLTFGEKGSEVSILVVLGLKCVQHKLDIAGNCIITWASLLYHICKEKQVNLNYAACHKKC